MHISPPLELAAVLLGGAACAILGALFARRGGQSETRRSSSPAHAGPNVFSFGGQTFVEMDETTQEHDEWMSAEWRKAAIGSLVSTPGEPREAYAERLTDEMVASGKMRRMIAGMLLPAGMDPVEWTPEVAEEVAGVLAKLTDPAEKAELRARTAELLKDFFVAGLLSLSDSSAASGSQEARPEGETQPASETLPQTA